MGSRTKYLTELGLRTLREQVGPPMGQIMDVTFGPGGERTRHVTKRGFFRHPIHKDFSDIDPDNYLGKAPDAEFVPIPRERNFGDFAVPLPHVTPSDYKGPIPAVRPAAPKR